LGISPGAVIADLHEGLGMKSLHFRWFPHALTDNQKAKRLRYAQEMIEALDTNSRTGFEYLLAGDELWMAYDQSPTGMSAIDRSCVDEKVRPTNYSQKTMVTVFFGVGGIALSDVLPTGVKLTSDHFCCNIIEALEEVVYPEGRVPGTTRYTLHFDNAPVHEAEKVQRKLDQCQFRRLEHPPNSPDLIPRDFFLFGHIHEKMQFLSYGTVDELQEAVTSTVEAIPKTKLVQVFQTWRWRFERTVQEEGNQFEQTESDATNSISF
jgi:hypothetical protein